MKPPIFLTCIFIFISSLTTLAQPPEQFTYQAVVRDSNNFIIRNTTIGLRLSVLKDSSNSTTPLYSEIHTLSTNGNGLITTEIGGGAVQSGDFSTIMWGDGIYFIKTEIDVDGGSDYEISGVTRVLSVPYALYARTAQMFPRMTTSQRDSIKNPEQGLQIFNLTTGCLEVNVGIPDDPVWIAHSDCRGLIENLICDSASLDFGLAVGIPTSNRVLTIPYAGGNSGVYSNRLLQSTGVEGISATMRAGAFDTTGNLEFSLSGIPQDTGTASFTLILGGQSCEVKMPVNFGMVEELTCDSAVFSGPLNIGESVDNVTLSIPYKGGNGGPYFENTFSSTGVIGVVAKYDSGVFEVGNGVFEVDLSGIPISEGELGFSIEIGSKICAIDYFITDTTISDTPVEINASSGKGPVQILPDEPVWIYVTDDGWQTLSGLSFSLNWDPSVACYSALDVDFDLSLHSNNFDLNQTLNGAIGFSYINLFNPVHPGDTLFAVQLTACGDPGTSTPITISDDPVLIDATGPFVPGGIPPQPIQVSPPIGSQVSFFEIAELPVSELLLGVEDGLNVQLGDTQWVCFTVDSVTNFSSLQFSLEWDTLELDFIELDFGRDLGGLSYSNFATDADGVIGFSWFGFSGSGLKSGDTLFCMQLVLEGPPGSERIISLGDTPLEPAASGLLIGGIFPELKVGPGVGEELTRLRKD